MKNPTIRLIQVAVLAVVTTVSAVSWSQPGSGRRGGDFGNMMTSGGMTPDYMLRDLRRFETALDLTKEQLVIVEQILRDYDESFREASDTSRESIGDSFRSMRGNEDDPARQQSRELRTQMREIREKIDSARQLDGEDGMSALEERLNKELEVLRKDMQDLRVQQWSSPERQAAFEDVALLMQDQLRLKRKMKIEFEGDLVAILTDSQQALWPPLKRQLIRDRLLPRGRLSGETVDVMSLVDQQDYDDQTLVSLLPILSQWDEQVTAALERRDDHMVEHQGSLMTAMRTMDTGAGLSVMKEQANLAEAVRDINDSSVQDIVLVLPEDLGSKFDRIAKERGYPRIFRPTRVDRSFQAAMELDELEPDILNAMIELYEAFKLEVQYANEQIYSATHRWESQEQLDRMNRFAERMTGGSSERPESPIRKAQDDRRKIEDNYLEQLKLLLTPEQLEALGGLDARSQRGQRDDQRNRDRDNGDRDRGQRNFGNDREEFMQRFDKNGDGTIDESERQEIREFFRNGGGDRGGNRGGSDRGGRGGNSSGGGSGSGAPPPGRP